MSRLEQVEQELHDGCFHFAGRSSGDAGLTRRLGPDAPAGGGFLKLRETPGPWEAASIRIRDDFVPVVWPPRLAFGHRAPTLIDFVDRFTVGPGFLAVWRRDGRPFREIPSSVLKRARDAAVELFYGYDAGLNVAASGIAALRSRGEPDDRRHLVHSVASVWGRPFPAKQFESKGLATRVRIPRVFFAARRRVLHSGPTSPALDLAARCACTARTDARAPAPGASDPPLRRCPRDRFKPTEARGGV